MTCKDVNGMLDRLMDGELTEDERRELEAHGQTCPECAAEIRATLEMKALFEETSPEADVPLAAQARWRGAIRQAAKADRRRKLTRWISSAAAAVVVLVGVGLALNGSLTPKQDAAQQLAVPMAVQESAEVETADAAEAESEEAALEASDDAADMAVNNAAFEADMAVEAAGETAGEAETRGVANEAEVREVASEASESAVIETDGAKPIIGAAEVPMGSVAFKGAGEALDAGELMATMAPEAEAAGAVEDMEEAEAYEEAEAVEAPMCAAAAQQSAACEYAIQAQSVEIACELVSELAGEFEGMADVQSVEGGSANVYVELDAQYAGEFLSGVAKLDDSANPADLPEVTGEGAVLILLVIEPAK